MHSLIRAFIHIVIGCAVVVVACVMAFFRRLFIRRHDDRASGQEQGGNGKQYFHEILHVNAVNIDN